MSRFAYTYEDPSYEYDDSKDDDIEQDSVPSLTVTEKVNVTPDETYYGA